MSGKPRPGRIDWGWHRLADDVAQSLVDAADVGHGDLVLDLGAGDGVITRRLAAAGARVIAFELHADRAARLRRVAGSGVKVVRADVRDLRLPTRPFRVIANPPFDGISAILVRLTSTGSRLVRADLVVPRSVAFVWQRRLEQRGRAWSVTAVAALPRSAFTPRPRIDTCIMTIERHGPQPTPRQRHSSSRDSPPMRGGEPRRAGRQPPVHGRRT